MTRLAGGPHVVALHGACVDDQSLVVVMELLEVSGGVGNQSSSDVRLAASRLLGWP